MICSTNQINHSEELRDLSERMLLSSTISSQRFHLTSIHRGNVSSEKITQIHSMFFSSQGEMLQGTDEGDCGAISNASRSLDADGTRCQSNPVVPTRQFQRKFLQVKRKREMRFVSSFSDEQTPWKLLVLLSNWRNKMNNEQQIVSHLHVTRIGGMIVDNRWMLFINRPTHSDVLVMANLHENTLSNRVAAFFEFKQPSARSVNQTNQ